MNRHVFAPMLTALAVALLIGCGENALPSGPSAEVPAQFASDLAGVVFNSTLHPPDPCVDGLGANIEGVAQMTLRLRSDGDYDVEWRGLITDTDGGTSFFGGLANVGANLEFHSGTEFSGTSANGGSDLVRLVGDGLGPLAGVRGDLVIAAPEEYEAQVYMDEDLVLVGNFVDHPPDPCVN